ncbi:helix-turn-helix domain-containing protein [Gloeothece verrucosa]|nr:helix-turn-helix transcriptional regulator [Gloeothece verrucosa]
MTKDLRFICNLKQILEEKNLNQSELHRKSGVSMTTIRNLTSGAILERIDRGSTAKLLEALDCSFDQLYKIEWLEIED